MGQWSALDSESENLGYYNLCIAHVNSHLISLNQTILHQRPDPSVLPLLGMSALVQEMPREKTLMVGFLDSRAEVREGS